MVIIKITVQTIITSTDHQISSSKKIPPFEQDFFVVASRINRQWVASNRYVSSF